MATEQQEGVKVGEGGIFEALNEIKVETKRNTFANRSHTPKEKVRVLFGRVDQGVFALYGRTRETENKEMFHTAKVTETTDKSRGGRQEQ